MVASLRDATSWGIRTLKDVDLDLRRVRRRCPELPIDEIPDCPGPIGVDALDEIRISENGLEVRIGSILEYGMEALPPGGGVDGLEAFGKGDRLVLLREPESLIAPEEAIHGKREMRQELHLAGDGTCQGFAGDGGVNCKFIRQLVRLTHILTVAEELVRSEAGGLGSRGPLAAGHGHGDAALPVLLKQAAHRFS